LHTKPLHSSLVEKYIQDIVRKIIINNTNGYVLDLGCGDKPFLPDIRNQIKYYVGADHPDTLHLNIKVEVYCIADCLPFKNNSFDTVLLTQVIEHLENPLLALNEIQRILKQNGTLIISWPFLYPVHEAPRDFFRYTEFGMRNLAEKAGFNILLIRPVSGFWITWFSFFSIYIQTKSKTLYIVVYPILIIFKYLCLLCEQLDSKSKIKWTWNYCALLRKENGVKR